MNKERLRLLKQYHEEEPDDPFNLYALANEYMASEPGSAKGYFDQLLEKHPDYLPTYYQAAQLYTSLEKFHLALEIYEKGIALADAQNNGKTLQELRSAYQGLLFELED